MWSESCRKAVSEPPWHGDRVGAEVSCRQGSDEGGQVWPAHREVAGEDLSEALVELSLNQLNKVFWNILLDRFLCSEAGVYFVHCFQECCRLKHQWVALLQY